jgi:hypothetical protein
MFQLFDNHIFGVIIIAVISFLFIEFMRMDWNDRL